jgi:hypothetical protein
MSLCKIAMERQTNDEMRYAVQHCGLLSQKLIDSLQEQVKFLYLIAQRRLVGQGYELINNVVPG